VDEKCLEFLKRLREQVRTPERDFRTQGRFEGERRNVYTGDAAHELGMEFSEREACLAELVRDGYLYPHPKRSREVRGVYRITDEGIARADEG
jgi:hypothetical protein